MCPYSHILTTMRDDITAFFMRKGADCLSKWVGEAERQLRLLFEEAKKCQPSIIFFDEIDGEEGASQNWLSCFTESSQRCRSCTGQEQQAGTDSCVNCFDTAGVDGRNGWSR